MLVQCTSFTAKEFVAGYIEGISSLSHLQAVDCQAVAKGEHLFSYQTFKDVFHSIPSALPVQG